MPKTEAIIRRFPTEELAIWRLCGRDADFLSACEDYEVAAGALQHWETGSAIRAEEYRQMLRDIEAEIRTCLDAGRDGRQASVELNR
jgi:hypothetical protein